MQGIKDNASMKEEQGQRSAKRGLPWWAHLFIAIILYCLLQYGPSLFYSAGEGKEAIIVLGKQAAPICAIIFLLLAAGSLYRNDDKQADRQDEQPDPPADQ